MIRILYLCMGKAAHQNIAWKAQKVQIKARAGHRSLLWFLKAAIGSSQLRQVHSTVHIVICAMHMTQARTSCTMLTRHTSAVSSSRVASAL